jgi:hypothetical protein
MLNLRNARQFSLLVLTVSLGMALLRPRVACFYAPGA